MAATGSVDIEGRQIKLSNLGKVLYPEVGFTKAHVIDYYIRIAPTLLPHLRDRPLTMKRYPDGVDGHSFYEKNCPWFRPDWVETTPVYSHHRKREIEFCLANDLPTLVWMANLADIELHPSLALARDLGEPTSLVFDLDPGQPADVVQCCDVALLLRTLFDHLGVASFPKTSGSKGLQLYVPLNTPVGYEQTKTFARTVAELLEREHPDLVVSNMKKSLRGGKVLVDWSQNDEHKTTVAVYSLRAKSRPTVSTPLEWAEVERTANERDPRRLTFLHDQVLARVEQKGDLFRPVLEMKQQLPALRL